MAKVITFGELMLRLQPFNYERFVQASSFEATFGGGEANVAVSLANYGMDAEFVTKLPAHVHRVSDAIQPSHPLSSPSPLASQHQSLFQ